MGENDNMDRYEWLRLCAEQYESRGGMTPEQARESAQIALEVELECGAGLSTDPVAAADADIDCWDNDGDEE